MYTSEVYPTTVRAMGSGLAYAMISVGYNVPPLLEMAIVSVGSEREGGGGRDGEGECEMGRGSVRWGGGV